MAKQKGLKGIIFDFDGTLVNLPIDYERMRKRLKKLFIRYGVTSEFRPLLESISESLSRLEDMGTSLKEVDAVRKKAYEIIEEEELTGANKATLEPGVNELLGALKKRKIKIIIASRNGVRCIQRCITQLGLPAPDIIVSRDDFASVDMLKPNPEHFLLPLRRLEMNPSDVIVIGDSTHDIEGGQAAGICTVLLERGKQNIKIEPDFRIRSLNEVSEMIKNKVRISCH